MKKLLFLGVIFVTILLAGCGNSKNEDKTDSGEAANDADADKIDTNSSDSDSDNGDSYEPQPDDDPDDTGSDETANDADADIVDTNLSDSDPDNGDSYEPQPDDDPDDTDSGNSGGYSDGCSTKTSYGSTSFTRDESNVFKDCARETQKVDCYPYQFDAAEFISKLQKVTIIFKKDSETSHDFIPDSMAFSHLTGCDIYHAGGTPEDASPCLDPCPKFYFSTDNETFKIVNFQHNDEYYPNAPLDNAYFYSYNADEKIALTIETYNNTASFNIPGSKITVPVEIQIDEN